MKYKTRCSHRLVGTCLRPTEEIPSPRRAFIGFDSTATAIWHHSHSPRQGARGRRGGGSARGQRLGPDGGEAEAREGGRRADGGVKALRTSKMLYKATREDGENGEETSGAADRSRRLPTPTAVTIKELHFNSD